MEASSTSKPTAFVEEVLAQKLAPIERDRYDFGHTNAHGVREDAMRGIASRPVLCVWATAAPHHNSGLGEGANANNEHHEEVYRYASMSNGEDAR